LDSAANPRPCIAWYIAVLPALTPIILNSRRREIDASDSSAMLFA
jgi:hypothetical protein